MANTTTYSWDEENRLTSVTLPNSGSEEYSYAADGLRRSKTMGAQTTRFVWDEENLLQEWGGSQIVAHYTNQPDGYGPLLSQRCSDGESTSGAQFNAVSFGSAAFNQSGGTPAAPASSFYGFDLSANTRVLSDESGSVSDTYVNTAFGKPVSTTGSTTTPYRFGGEVGYYQDTDQRSYVRARHYSSSQGRWISRDPIGFDGGDWNLHRYVENNPMFWVDPSGLKYVDPGTDPWWEALRGRPAPTAKRPASCPVCGPEIGNQLPRPLNLATEYFRSLSTNEKENACYSLVDLRGTISWDIFGLHDPNYQKQIGVFHNGCATTPRCQNTVMVFGKCHKAKDVNYLLYGHLFKICYQYYEGRQRNLGNQLNKVKVTGSILARINTKARLIKMRSERTALRSRRDRFTQSQLTSNVKSWKTVMYGNVVGAKIAASWAIAGYRGTKFPAAPTELGRCGRCSIAYRGMPLAPRFNTVETVDAYMGIG